MPKLESKRKVEVKLVLSEDEAKWLHDFIQNPRTEGGETPKEVRFRLELYNALHKELRLPT